MRKIFAASWRKLGGYRRLVVAFAVLAVLLVAPTVVLARASAGTDERVARWFLSGVDIKKVSAETKKENQYLLAALALGTASFLALCTAILFEAKHLQKSRSNRSCRSPSATSPGV